MTDADFQPQSHDLQFHKHSGDVCDNHYGFPITWHGHLCEGADLTAPIGHNFCLWIKCGARDVPADGGEIGHMGLVTCPDCISLAGGEPTEADLERLINHGVLQDDAGARPHPSRPAQKVPDQ